MNEITVYDKNGNSITELTQWDSNIEIQIKEPSITKAYQMHFCNKDSEVAYTMKSTYDRGILKCTLPNILLKTPYTITGYVFADLNPEKRSIFTFKIYVRKKPRPMDYAYVDNVDALNLLSVLQECSTYAKEAKSYAIGNAGFRPNENTDNAKYYYEQAKSASDSAASDANAAGTYASNAESYASTAGSYASTANSHATNANFYATNAQAYMQQAESAASRADQIASGDISGKAVNFTQATTIANIQSGESFSVLFGKISKFMGEEITQPDVNAIFT